MEAHLCSCILGPHHKPLPCSISAKYKNQMESALGHLNIYTVLCSVTREPKEMTTFAFSSIPIVRDVNVGAPKKQTR